LTNYTVSPQKGLSIPVPKDSSKVANIKAFWLDLIWTFLPRTEFELSMYSCIFQGQPKLIVTFNGVTPETFQALFEEETAQEHLIDIGQAAWVEDYAMQDNATLKLSSYMEHEELSLLRLVETFRQGFAG
jgi:type VI secretion system protein ImpM